MFLLFFTNLLIRVLIITLQKTNDMTTNVTDRITKSLPKHTNCQNEQIRDSNYLSVSSRQFD